MTVPAPIILAVAQTELGLLSFLSTMDGPDFLGLYLFWFVVVFAGVLALRKMNFDTPLTTIGGLCLFEGLGAARFFIGSAHGMHKWDYLFLMMFIGGLFFVIRPHHLKQDGSGGFWSGGGCGGSCGGGGCGGGCGGCGG